MLAVAAQVPAVVLAAEPAAYAGAATARTMQPAVAIVLMLATKRLGISLRA
jgi:hypothetical protein